MSADLEQARSAPSAQPHPASDPRHASNLERLIADLYEVYDLGALEHFEHLVEPHRDGSGRQVDLFRLVFPGGRQRQMPFSQARSWLAGFFAGRDYPRGAARSTVTPS